MKKNGKKKPPKKKSKPFMGKIEGTWKMTLKITLPCQVQVFLLVVLIRLNEFWVILLAVSLRLFIALFFPSRQFYREKSLSFVSEHVRKFNFFVFVFFYWARDRKNLLGV